MLNVFPVVGKHLTINKMFIEACIVQNPFKTLFFISGSYLLGGRVAENEAAPGVGRRHYMKLNLDGA